MGGTERHPEPHFIDGDGKLYDAYGNEFDPCSICHYHSKRSGSLWAWQQMQCASCKEMRSIAAERAATEGFYGPPDPPPLTEPDWDDDRVFLENERQLSVLIDCCTGPGRARHRQRGGHNDQTVPTL